MAISDLMVLCGAEEVDTEMEYYEALQRQINNGQVWKMEGSMGRGAMRALEAGQVMLPAAPKPLDQLTDADFIRDYWGNVVPFRDFLKEGTKGTYEHVAAHNGKEYADHLAAI